MDSRIEANPHVFNFVLSEDCREAIKTWLEAGGIDWTQVKTIHVEHGVASVITYRVDDRGQRYVDPATGSAAVGRTELIGMPPLEIDPRAVAHHGTERLQRLWEPSGE